MEPRENSYIIDSREAGCRPNGCLDQTAFKAGHLDAVILQNYLKEEQL